MNKRFLLIFLLSIPSFFHAHTLLLNVLDNEDDTISVEGFFSTGEPAIGAQIRLESLVSEKILYKKRLPYNNELTIQIPKEPYTIILDGGPQHQIEKQGIAPLNGFSKNLPKQAINVDLTKLKEEKSSISKLMIVLIGIVVGLVLLSMTIFACALNTKYLIKKLKENRKKH